MANSRHSGESWPSAIDSQIRRGVGRPLLRNTRSVVHQHRGAVTKYAAQGSFQFHIRGRRLVVCGRRLLATGRFLTMRSSYTLMLPGRHPSLRALPVALDNARGTIAITMLKNRTLSPLAELFVKTTRAVVKPLVKVR